MAARRLLWALAIGAPTVALLALLSTGLGRDPQARPSALVDRAAPAFSLPRLDEPERMLSSDAMRGRVWLLNVWASWCAGCRNEHALLQELAGRPGVNLVGLNYKDQRPQALAWLGELGNPYQSSLSDTQGRVGIDYGVYGVPETFVIDRDGVIRERLAGPLTPELVRDRLLPLLRKLDE